MTRYPNKAAWARAKAQEFRDQATSLPPVPSSNWRALRGRMTAQRTLRLDAERFERMAVRFAAQGE